MEALLTQLRSDLTRPRELSAQVVHTIADRFEVTSDTLSTFFEQTVPTLDDQDLDLTFSPLFTPTSRERATYMALLKDTHLTSQDVQALITTLEGEKLTGNLIMANGQTFDLPLTWVTLARFVERLYLNKPLPTGMLALIDSTVPEADRPWVNVLAREAVWKEPARQTILRAFLTIFAETDRYNLGKVEYLTNFVRTYRPAQLADVPRQLDSLIRSCESDLNRSEERGFHDHVLKEKYTLREERARDLSHEEHVRLSYLQMMDMANHLKADYQAICEQHPELAAVPAS